MRRRIISVAVAVTVGLVSTCSGPTEIQAPAGVSILAVADAAGVPVLAGTRAGQPVLVAGDSPVPLTPTSAYADGAGWLSVATAGDRITAIAGQRGGAHGNVRWTVWSGTTRGVTEIEQPFETFGGHEMGQLVGVAYVGDEPVVVGSWQSAEAGFDVAIWRVDGSGHWHRTPSTGTDLASTRTVLVQPAAVAGGDRLVVVGQLNDLVAGRTKAAAWVLDGTRWTTVTLPTDASAAGAEAVSCDHAGCSIAGRADGRLVAWDLAPDRRVTERSLAARVPDERTSPIVLRTPRGSTYVTTIAGRADIITVTSSRWTTTDSPAGTPICGAVIDGTPLLVTTASDASRVWRLPA
jgi:hypothetical protein